MTASLTLSLLSMLAAPSSGAEARARPSLTLIEEPRNTARPTNPGVGDLWPSCWSDDDELYAAHGDGRGFSSDKVVHPLGVNRLSGSPGKLRGRLLARTDDVSFPFGDYDRKPSGMLCAHGDLYLAVQYLDSVGHRFVEAAAISVSRDKGKTWERSRPLFTDRIFTTIFFLDFGKDSRDATDRYVYAYGLDQNWKSRHELFLARVRPRQVRVRSAWTFYAGTAANGQPRFSSDIREKVPVLTDPRKLYPGLHDYGPIAQGSVTYIPRLKRFIYASWTELTHEFYEAPAPWGPWTHFHHMDFGPYPWTPEKAGGYATTIPSKFVSPDGRALWLQSNCFGASHNCDEYTFNLRRLRVGVDSR